MTTTEEVFDFIMEVFPFSIIQDFETIYGRIEKAGGSVKEFCELVTNHKETHKLYIEESFKAVARNRLEFKMKARRCDKCGGIMMLSAVNTVPGNQVGGNFKSLWTCSDVMGCGNDEYSEVSLEDEAAKYDLREFYDPAVREKIEKALNKRKRTMARRRMQG